MLHSSSGKQEKVRSSTERTKCRWHSKKFASNNNTAKINDSISGISKLPKYFHNFSRAVFLIHSFFDFGTNAANRPPPRNRKLTWPKLDHLTKAQTNATESVWAVSRAAYWIHHVFTPDIHLTDGKTLNWECLHLSQKMYCRNLRRFPWTYAMLIRILTVKLLNLNPRRQFMQQYKRRH